MTKLNSDLSGKRTNTTLFYNKGSDISLLNECSTSLSLPPRKDFALKLFLEDPDKYKDLAATAFPFLLSGPQPIINDPISNKLLIFNYDKGEWEPPRRCITHERAKLQKYFQLLDYYLPTQPEHYPCKGYSYLIHQQASKLPPLHQSCRAVVVIPVLDEEAIIEDTLKESSYQNLPPDRFELILVVNSTLSHQRDHTEEIVRKYKFSNPNFHLHLISVTLPPPFNGGGMSRRIGSDVALLRSVRRNQQDGSLYIVCDDADCLGIPRDHLSNIITKLDNSPGTDILLRTVMRDPLTTGDHDILKALHNLRYLTESCFFPRVGRSECHFVPYNPGRLTDRQFWLRAPTSGCAMAIPAESLAEITGGFEPVSQRSDLPQGPKFAILRGIPLSDVLYLSRVTVKKDPYSRAFQLARRDMALLEQRLRSLEHTPDESINIQSNYRTFTDPPLTNLLRSPENLDSILDKSQLYQRCARISNIQDELLVRIVNSHLAYYTDHFFPYLFDKDTDIITSWTSFLSIYLGGSKGVFEYDQGSVKLVKPNVLRNTVINQQKRFAEGKFRIQKISLRE